MTDRPRFKVSGSKFKLKASCTARNEKEQDRIGKKSKMEKRRLRKRNEMKRYEKDV